MDRRHRFALQAETWVADYLAAQGGLVLARRWRCRGGEIDLVIRLAGVLCFVEVKARGRNSWDSAGWEAVGVVKQRRLLLAAALFLAAHPELARSVCRFDVALVGRTPDGGVRLVAYIAGAFEGSGR
ncbi:YraN family protein [Gloeobacter morelensis]|uniref:UPF0102 protein ISF26_07225 n=1 Tax=Gloeobacter morelensis MG652769 TaxID=2781736 RepID=A0ABY3PQL3_9CYAN|nr:YraN family protein [Gloeobacter morelensis]UFP95998.1 YraN family protein [Gloeobacter morelensis MG652769]